MSFINPLNLAIKKLRAEGVIVSVHKINNEYVHCLGSSYRNSKNNLIFPLPELRTACKFRLLHQYAEILYVHFKQLAMPMHEDPLKRFTLNP